MENIFASFTPIELNSTPSKEDIANYYSQSAVAVDEHLAEYLGLNNLNSSNTDKVTDNTIMPTNYNISEIIGSLPIPKKLEVPKTENNAVTTTKPPANKDEFLQLYRPIINKLADEVGLSKELLLAQIALETGWGKHTPGNNVGGIKATTNWKGPQQTLMTTEFENGQYKRVLQPFRAYNTLEEGIKGYVDFLTQNKRYKGLFGITDPYKAADLMAKSGYATSPKYKASLYSIIKQL